MIEVKIPFMDEFKEVMLMGTKRQTARNKRYCQAGDVFHIFGAMFTVTRVYKCDLATVALAYEAEGCTSEEDFIGVWVRLHKRLGWTPDKEVYVHEFERVPA